MSFILDPLALFVLGIILAFARSKHIISPQQTRILGICIVAVFLIISPLLYLDVLEWPLNFNLKPVAGSIWMFNTDYTGIYKNYNPPNGYSVWLVISGGWVFLMFLLYPLWLIFGYSLTRWAFFSKKYKIVSGLKSLDDVKSKNRLIKPMKYSVKRNPDKFQALEDGLKDLGGLETFIKPTDHLVVIKANISGGNPLIEGSFTDPDLVGKLTSMIYKITGTTVKVVDSDMVWTDFEPVARAEGWYRAAKEWGFDLVNLADTKLIKFDFGQTSKTGTQLVSTLMLDADVLISIPAMKTHLLTSVTLGMKNFYGTHPEGDKAKYHKIGIEEVVVDIIRAFRPNLTIIDGSVGGQAIGPLSVKPVYGQTLVFSNDVLTADSVACQIMGFKPNEIVHLWNAYQEGLGEANIQFDFSTLPFALPTDGKWERPHPDVSKFYNDMLETASQVVGVPTFFNNAADFLLYDTATLPLLREVTPVVLTAFSDTIYGLLKFSHKAKFNRKKRIQLDHVAAMKLYPQITSEAWPTKQLEYTLEAIGTLPENLVSYPPQNEQNFVEIIDNTEKANFALEFMPRISTIGFELRDESKSKIWSGIQYRLLESKDKKQRVLQNILIWTKQRFLFSRFYHIMLPLLFGFLGMLIISSVKMDSVKQAVIAVTVVFATLSIIGGPELLQTISYYINNKRRIYRNALILPVYGVVFLIGIYDIYDKIYLGSVDRLLIIPFGGNQIEIYLPIVSIVFFGIAILALALSIFLRNNPLLASHDMDYGPVWVYLTKIKSENELENNNPKDWQINKILYDGYHYDIDSVKRETLERDHNLETSNRAMLEIDNNWHAFYVGTSTSNMLAWLGITIAIISVIGMLVATFYYWGSNSLLLLLTLLFIALIIGLYLSAAKFKSTLVLAGSTPTKEELENAKDILSHGKLDVLWNLRESSARLKIIDKILDPFNESLNWNTFNDPRSPKEFAGQEIQLTLAKTINLIVILFWSIVTVIVFSYQGYRDLNNSTIGLIGLTFVIIVCILATIYGEYEPQQVILFTILSAILAIVDESIFTQNSAGLWTYTANNIALAITGWPLILFFCYSIAHGIQDIFRDNLEKFHEKKYQLFLTLIVALIFGILLIAQPQPNYLGLIRENTTMLVLVIIITILGLTYILITPVKNTLPILVITAIAAGIMEIIGNLSGFWTYLTFGNPKFSINYLINQFPLFLFIFWVFRICVILIILKIIKEDIPIFLKNY